MSSASGRTQAVAPVPHHGAGSENVSAAAASSRSQPAPSWRLLPLASRCYIAGVVGAGVTLLGIAAPQVSERDAPLVVALAVLSFVAAFAKVTVAVPSSSSTISFCYVIDFIALLAVGPPAAVLTGATGAWSQVTFRTIRAGANYRAWFSIAAVIVTVNVAGTIWDAFETPSLTPRIAVLLALAATAIAYFVANTLLVAAAVGLSTGQPTLHVWRTNFLSLWTGHIAGFTIAVVAATGLTHSTLWLFALTVLVLGLTYHKLHAYVVGLSESLTDAMTTLPNLRYLRTHVPQEISRAKRERKPLALIMIDLDEFKMINDTYGHSAGDMALRHVAETLRASVRSYDVCARYAGDEFVVVLPGCPAEEAEKKARLLQRAVAERAFEPVSGRSIAVRISAGTAVYPADGETLDALVAVADREMFQDKRGSRHRAVPGGQGAPAPTEELAGILAR